MRKITDKNLIENIRYYTEELFYSVKEIAKILNLSESTVTTVRKKYKIKVDKSKIKTRLNISKEFLYNEYIVQQKSMQDIANYLTVDLTTILSYLRKYNIKVRSQYDGKRIKDKQLDKYNQVKCSYCSQLILRSNYRIKKTKKHFCSKECLKLNSKKSKKQVKKEKELELVNQIKQFYCEQDLTQKQTQAKLNIKQSQLYRLQKKYNLYKLPKYIDYNVLFNLYIEKYLSIYEIAKKLGYTESYIKSQLIKQGLFEDRSRGPKHYLWIDNGDRERLCLFCQRLFYPRTKQVGKFCSVQCYHNFLHNKAKKEGNLRTTSKWISLSSKIRKRDNQQCQKCGMNQDKHFKYYNTGLHVHHIIPIRIDPERCFDKSNLITYCAVCHLEEDKKIRETEKIRNE